jgi:hypothetical protein
MDGQPLRYRLTDDGHFLLYSVGLDGVDNGGQLRYPKRKNLFDDGRDYMGQPREPDLVWPLPASAATVAAQRQVELTAKNAAVDDDAEREAVWLWVHTDKRQTGVGKLLQNAVLSTTPDKIVQRRPLSQLLRNLSTTGTNTISIAEMLTLKQVITGDEPETVTFELPVAYDSVTNLGNFGLMLDPNYQTDDEEGNGPQVEEMSRATNGDCLLVWHTIYESFGKHALQATLYLNESGKDEPDVSGPFLPWDVTNLCQFSVSSATYDVDHGALFRGRLPESNGLYAIECVTTNGEHLKTLTGTTTNGQFKVVWDLVDDHGHRLGGETFNSIVHITLPDSGRTQNLRGP